VELPVGNAIDGGGAGKVARRWVELVCQFAMAVTLLAVTDCATRVRYILVQFFTGALITAVELQRIDAII
jgi:hypothetical protein